VAAIPPLARSFGSHRRRLRGCLSAIAIPDSDNVHVVLRVWAFPAIHRLDLNRLRHSPNQCLPPKRRLGPAEWLACLVAARSPVPFGELD